MGVKAATELMLSGQHLSAKALAAGLVDQLAEGDDPLAAGLAYVNELLARGVPPARRAISHCRQGRGPGRAGRDSP